MSREIRRVPLDFDAPLRKTWAGYLMPEELAYPPCPDCDNGLTPGRAWLNAAVRMLVMAAQDLGAQRLGRSLHPYLADNEYAPRVWDGPPAARFRNLRVSRPTEDLADLVAALSGSTPERAADYLGSGDPYTLADRLITIAGLDPETWGICPTCAGQAVVPSPELRAAHEAWEPAEPPAGDGWQLWETVSEGGPVSPVFPDAEALARWLAEEAPARERLSSIEVARRFVAAGWAPDGFSRPDTGYVEGPEWIGRIGARDA